MQVPEIIVCFPNPDLEVNPREQETRGLEILDELREGREACVMPWSEGWAIKPAIAEAITRIQTAAL